MLSNDLPNGSSSDAQMASYLDELGLNDDNLQSSDDEDSEYGAPGHRGWHEVEYPAWDSSFEHGLGHSGQEFIAPTNADGTSKCDVCGNDLVKQKYDNHRSGAKIAKWQESAARGCYFCAVILDGWQLYARKHNYSKAYGLTLTPSLLTDPFRVDASWKEHPRAASDKDKTGELEFYSVGEEVIELVNNVLAAQEGPLDETIERLQRWDTAAWSPFVPCRHIAPSSREAIPFILKAVQLCDETHKECSTSTQSFPRRVIEIPSDGSTTLRLIDPTDAIVGEYRKYVALSHCWGGLQHLNLLTTNRARLQKGFDLNDLPPLFRDAVELTRLLGVRYLWIDAIGIIQNDTVDWEIESGKMGAIYRDAYVTLVPSDSANGDQPFLSTVRSTLHLSIPIPSSQTIDPQNSLRPLVYVRERTHQHGHDSPLKRRAWCFQEYVISSRIIQFTDREITFHCNLGSYCECGELSYTGYDGPSYFAGFHNEVRRNWQALQSKKQIGSLIAESSSQYLTDYEVWTSLVREYSSLSLTFDKDQLPALSGLASEFCKRQDKMKTYIAGLWKEHFDFWLGWEAVGGELPADGAYIAPSWSWASVKGRVTYHRTDPNVLTFWTKAEDPAIKLKGENPLGEVISGECTLTGLVCETTLHLKQEAEVKKNRLGEGTVFVDGLSRQVKLDCPVEITGLETAGGIVNSARRLRTRPPFIAPPMEGDCKVWVSLLYTQTEEKGILAKFLVFGRPGEETQLERIGIISAWWEEDAKAEGAFKELVTWVEQSKKTAFTVI